VRGARRRRRRLRLALVAVPVVVLVAVVAVTVTILTGRLVVPSLSGKVYPIKYESEIATVADKYGIDPYLLAAMARTESGFDPKAESVDGALGLMQLLPTTAKWVTGLDSWKGPKNPSLTDPRDSLELGACYLSYLQRTLDPPMAAIAAYNAGQGIARQWVKAAGGADSFGLSDIPYRETKEFVRRVTHWRTLFQKAHPHAFSSLASGS
jgi:soluble lytic murein transglycosylase